MIRIDHPIFRDRAGRLPRAPLYTRADILSDLNAYPCDHYYLWSLRPKPNAVTITREIIIELVTSESNCGKVSSPLIFTIPFPRIGIVAPNHGARWRRAHPLHWSHSGDPAWDLLFRQNRRAA
jgi:hypothetical protein